MIRDEKKLRERIKKRLNSQKTIEFKGVMGRADGVVESSNGMIYVTLYNGDVIEIANRRLPRKPFRKIRFGYDSEYPNLLQALSFDDVYANPPPPGVVNHKESHSWFSYDAVDVYRQQIIHLLPRAAGGFILRVYAGNYKINGVNHFLQTTNIDMESELGISSGAEWVNVEIDSAGLISFNHGGTADSRVLLPVEEIPQTAADKYLLCSVKSYAGQTQIIELRADTDIFDPRMVDGSPNGGMRWRGEWDYYENYIPGDVVSLSDPYDVYADPTLYLCYDESLGNEPPDSAYWIPMAGAGGGGGGIAWEDIDDADVEPTLPAAGDKFVFWDISLGEIKSILWSTIKSYIDTLHLFLSNVLDDHVTATSLIQHVAEVIGYTPTVSGDWDGTPNHVKVALDELAERTKDLEDTGGGGGQTSGRLTLASGNPVITSPQANKTILYFTPFRGNKVTFLDGTTLSFSELSLDMSAFTKNCMYDIFRYNNAGTVAIEELSWGTDTAYNISAATAAASAVITFTAAQGTNPFAVNDIVGIQDIVGNMGEDVLHTNIWQVTAIGGSNPNWTVTLLAVVTTGKTYTSGGTIRKIKNTRTTNVVLDDGIYIKSGDDTRVYLGSVFITGNGYCEDTLEMSGVWNYYNRVDKTLNKEETATSWMRTNLTVVPANNKATNRLTVIIGITEDVVMVDLLTSLQPQSAVNTYGYASIGLDRVDVFHGKVMGGGSGETPDWFVFSAFIRNLCPIGVHFYSWNEASTTSRTVIFYGVGGNGFLKSGLEMVLKG